MGTLESLLRQALPTLLSPGQAVASAELTQTYKIICERVFDAKLSESLWDEPVLLRLDWLFSVRPPAETVFGTRLRALRDRVETVRRVNDLFFRLLDPSSSAAQVHEALQHVSPTDLTLVASLESSDRLTSIRDSDDAPSERIAMLLCVLAEDFGIDLTSRADVGACLGALKTREAAGVANALLVRKDGGDALVAPLEVRLQPGSGQVLVGMRCRDDFKATIERARLALLNRGFLAEDTNVICTLDLTDPIYVGTSIGLAAGASMYSFARRLVLDPYTGFTGDINLDKGEWRIKDVSGVNEKLAAARRLGCRRIFLPSESAEKLQEQTLAGVQLIPVQDIIDVLLRLEPRHRPLPGNSPQVQKLNTIRTFAQSKGWDVSAPRLIDGGVQLVLSPFHLPELTVAVYRTGTSMPKTHSHPEYQALLDALDVAGRPKVTIRHVERTFTVKDPSLRAGIRGALERLQPAEVGTEQYCDYVFKFTHGSEHIVVKQYSKGTLQLQGRGGDLYETLLEAIVPQYNLRHPQAELSITDLLGDAPGPQVAHGPTAPSAEPEISLPYIGTDESGKGDYFGSMVVAAVMADAATKGQLERLGVRDSKALSDKRCRELAAEIREICRGRYEEVELTPDRYNELYEEFQAEKKNLNHLLAWGHARAIETLLERHPCRHAVADQFGDEHYIRSRLMEKGRQLELVQMPKAERYVAVAAASILTRDRFLARLERLGREYGMMFPKGTSEAVVAAARLLVAQTGAPELRKVAKLHHKTTNRVLEDSIEPSG